MADVEEQMYEHQLARVVKLEKAVTELADAEPSTMSAPKLRKVKNAVNGVRTGLDAVHIDNSNSALVIKYQKLKLQFTDCVEELEGVQEEWREHLQLEKAATEVKKEIKARNDAFDRRLFRLQKIQQEVTHNSSEEDKQGARSTLAMLCNDGISEDGVEPSKISLWYDLKIDVGAILHPVEVSLNQSFNGSHVGSTNSAGINNGVLSNGGGSNGGSNSGGRGNRLEWKTLPKFDGDIANYSVFKSCYQARMVVDNVNNEMAAQWLGADCVMQDATLQTALIGLSYEEQWQMLDSRYSSEVLATQRALRPVSSDGKKQLKYGPELVKYVLDVTRCYKYMKRLDNPVDAWLLLSIMQQCNDYLPDKVSERIKQEVAGMQKAEPHKVIEILEMFSKMEPPKVVRQAVNIVYGDGRDDGGGRGDNSGGNRRLVCGFCSGDHKNQHCAEYKAMAAEDRLNAVIKNKMCQACLSTTHLLQEHDRLWECNLDGCKLKHHYSLHTALSAEAVPCLQSS